MIFVTFHNENELPVYSNTRDGKIKKIQKRYCKTEKTVLYYNTCCGSAGIGRQARLRILWLHDRVGSSPISRTGTKKYRA